MLVDEGEGSSYFGLADTLAVLGDAFTLYAVFFVSEVGY